MTPVPDDASDLDLLSAIELRGLLAARQVSPVELTERALRRAEATQSTINAFSCLMPVSARQAARRAEAAILRGDPTGPLHGLPVSVKDLIAVAGEPWEMGSRSRAGITATVDAPVVERVRAQGAILIGKTTTSEFGCKAVGDSPATGITRNPRDLSKTPGGSSAGAAASVAAGITSLAVGTDGGGSLRIPAALTGLVGFKAQFGRVPVWPPTATPTLAHVGALARTVGDAALLTSVLAGYDPRDPFSIAGPPPDLLAALRSSVEGVRIAWSATLGYARADPDIVRIGRSRVLALADEGALVEELEDILGADPEPIWSSEFYGGVGTHLRATLLNERKLVDPAVAERLDWALRQNCEGNRTRAAERLALRDRMERGFARFDVLITPTLPVSSLGVGWNAPAHLAGRGPISWSMYTYPFNLTGQPALSLCAGTAADGSPIGLQVVGPALGEALVIRVAAAIERATAQDRAHRFDGAPIP
ncbi:amidase [Methylobacterium sp. W2]|uniref:amidase n=1 Tax=Methylobacterium sp. W2 TaxID=2598107 RepID=UPI001D0C1C80|nr:amidase family protein [Methylobacterium sp. W2]MCC0806091.1 amidase [Methylobacterium sp. W2]